MGERRPRSRRRSAAGAERARSTSIDDALARIEERNPTLNAFTAVTAERARAKARAIDATRTNRSCRSPACPSRSRTCSTSRGLPTVAGSKINRARPPAERDSPLIERLEAAGAVLVGALNMGEYAYDFTGENVHDGPSRNPHDVTRMTGGSSGGSGGAVGGGLVPLALGSDTNGSIRVPSSLCGIFGLKPTYGRLTRARSFPFVASLDHLGPFARSTRDLALSYDAMQGLDADDAACVDRAGRAGDAAARARARRPAHRGRRRLFQEGRVPRGAGRARPRRQGGRRARRNRDSRSGARARRGLCHHRDRRRGAASRPLAQAGARFRSRRARPPDRRRHGAGHAGREGAEFPPLVSRARARIVRDAATRSWRRPRPAPRPRSASRPSSSTASNCRCGPTSGIYTQPISFIGLPVVAVPVPLKPLPIARADHRRALARGHRLRIAHALEQMGAVAAPRPNL